MESKNYYKEMNNLIIDVIRENFRYIKIIRSDIDFEKGLIYYDIIFNSISVGLIIDISETLENEEIESFIIGTVQKEIIRNFMKG